MFLGSPFFRDVRLTVSQLRCIITQIRYEVSMASTTMVHIRVDEKLKREACAALDGMGLSLSDAVRLLLVRVAAEKALPFEIRVPNTSTIQLRFI